jgi:hypothetical protein
LWWLKISFFTETVRVMERHFDSITHVTLWQIFHSVDINVWIGVINLIVSGSDEKDIQAIISLSRDQRFTREQWLYFSTEDVNKFEDSKNKSRERDYQYHSQRIVPVFWINSCVIQVRSLNTIRHNDSVLENDFWRCKRRFKRVLKNVLKYIPQVYSYDIVQLETFYLFPQRRNWIPMILFWNNFFTMR